MVDFAISWRVGDIRDGGELASQATAFDKPVPALTTDVAPSTDPSTNAAQSSAASPALSADQRARLQRLLALSAARMKSLPTLPIDLTKVTVPVLTITGEFDRPAWRTQRMWRELRDFRSAVLAGENHLTAAGFGGPIPPEYIQALVTFVNAHDR